LAAVAAAVPRRAGHRRRAYRKAKPLGGTLTTLVTAQLSVAVTLNVTLLVHALGAASQ